MALAAPPRMGLLAPCTMALACVRASGVRGSRLKSAFVFFVCPLFYEETHRKKQQTRLAAVGGSVPRTPSRFGSRLTATSSAFAFGELGRNVYRMLDAAKIINVTNWAPPPEVEKALAMVQDFAESQAEPIILEFTDYEAMLLRLEDGRKVPPEIYNHNGLSFRYLGPLDFQNAKRISMEDVKDKIELTTLVSIGSGCRSGPLLTVCLHRNVSKM